MTFPSAPELLGGLHPLHPYRGAFSLACENRRGSITLPMLEEFLQVQQQDEACSWSIASVPGQFTGPTAHARGGRCHDFDERLKRELVHYLPRWLPDFTVCFPRSAISPALCNRCGTVSVWGC
jgi:hypothetical protein